MQQSPSLTHQWAENYLVTKYGREVMNSLYKNIAEELSRFPAEAQNVVEPLIVADKIDPLIDHLFEGLEGEGDAKLQNEDELKIYDDFQNARDYNKGSHELEPIEREHMVEIIENTPCQLTEKKFSGYFLKPGAKHASDFFGVGYTENDSLRLSYDIARQFDMNNAVEYKTLENGAIRFNIYMYLGIDDSKLFVTGWIIDQPGDIPRITTAFRKGPKNDNRVR